MKKLVLTFAAIGLFFTTSQAQVAQVENGVTAEVAAEVKVAGEDFEKIEVAELPEAVSTAITNDFAEAQTQEAWVKEKEGKKIYKVKLNVEGEEKSLYADAEGNWLKKEDVEKKS